jgi:hypothetical protein
MVLLQLLNANASKIAPSRRGRGLAKSQSEVAQADFPMQPMQSSQYTWQRCKKSLGLVGKGDDGGEPGAIGFSRGVDEAVQTMAGYHGQMSSVAVAGCSRAEIESWD